MSNIDTLIPPGLVDFLDLEAVVRIVDVGCGNGSFTSYLLSQAASGLVWASPLRRRRRYGHPPGKCLLADGDGELNGHSHVEVPSSSNQE